MIVMGAAHFTRATAHFTKARYITNPLALMLRKTMLAFKVGPKTILTAVHPLTKVLNSKKSR